MRLLTFVAPLAVVFSFAVLLVAAPRAAGSQTDCLSYGYACTPGYTGANAAGTWAWTHYGGSYAQTANGYHNCTLYAAWRLEQNGMSDPGNWGNAVDWASHNGGGNNTPAVGAIAWWGSEVAGGSGHVAYVDQVNGSQVHVMADNFPGSSSQNGYTDAGWIAASSVDKFLHPHDVSGGGFSNWFEAAFQANTGQLWSVGSDAHGSWGFGMKAGTSPALTALSGGGYELAFQANTGQLWSVGADMHGSWGFGMKAGTSPAIARLANGGYEMAFQANTGSLWSVGNDMHGDWQQGMMAGTSPSITGLSGGGYEMAFQANTGELITIGNAGNTNWHLGMMAGTSPSITLLSNGGFEVAFQANTGQLWSVGSDAHGSWGFGMKAGTSPSITLLSNGGYEMAFQANTGSLWSVGSDMHGDWQQGMMVGTSPTIAAVANGGYEMAFQANTGELITIGGAGNTNWHLGMMAGTSPGVGSTGSSGGSPGSSVAPPASNSSPTLSGTAQQGNTLTLAHGAWTNGATSYSDQWLDCDSAGNNCTAISGATSQTYTVAASDVGHTIRVKESATNVAGTGGPVQSSPTSVVTAPRTGGTVSSGGTGCVVPRLRHKTFSQARRALRRRHCQLGKVRKPRHVRGHHVLRVSRQSIAAGTRRRAGTRINLTLR